MLDVDLHVMWLFLCPIPKNVVGTRIRRPKEPLLVWTSLITSPDGRWLYNRCSGDADDKGREDIKCRLILGPPDS